MYVDSLKSCFRILQHKHGVPREGSSKKAKMWHTIIGQQRLIEGRWNSKETFQITLNGLSNWPLAKKGVSRGTRSNPSTFFPDSIVSTVDAWSLLPFSCSSHASFFLQGWRRQRRRRECEGLTLPCRPRVHAFLFGGCGVGGWGGCSFVCVLVYRVPFIPTWIGYFLDHGGVQC